MKLRITTLCAFALAAMAPVVRAAAAPPADEAKPSASAKPAEDAKPADASGSRARAFVQGFYDWYVQPDAERSVEVVLKTKSDVLAPDLSQALQADLEASAKEPEEVVGLDFDPFLNAQEQAYRYQVGEAVERAGRYRLAVFGFWGDQARPQKHHDLTVEVGCTATACRFENFLYPESGPTHERDLVGVLKALAKQRAAAPKR
jgi:hypothetical protein